MLVMVVVLVAVLSTIAPVAHAGTNGQELQITCPKATSVVVIGLNQNGQEVAQPFYLDSSGATTFTTSGWWWVGPVSILWYGPNGNGQYYDNVPQQQNGDIYTSDCNNPASGGWNVDPNLCNPSLSPTSTQRAFCLGAAPVDGACYDAPCVPFLDSAYIATPGNSFYCFLSSVDGNEETGWGTFTNWGGATTSYSYVWGISYMEANGAIDDEWYNGVLDPNNATPATVTGPLYITGSAGAGFICNVSPYSY